MKFYKKEIIISTNKNRELINITEYLYKVLEESGIKNGILLVFVPHATSALFANEDEPNIRKDYLNLLEKLVPKNGNYYHNLIDNNADSHLLSMLLKQFYIFPIVDGKIVRGTWQDLFFVELDGPRSYRKILFLVLGE